MSISTDIRTEALVAQFRAQRPAPGKDERQRSASGTLVTAPIDRVEISLTAHMTVEAVNGVTQDSVVEQINKVIQDAGIDLTVEEAYRNQVDVSPEAVAQEIVKYATGFLEEFRQNHLDESGESQTRGFMTLIRGAISDGFQQARNFLQGITTLDESIQENIDRTYELTQGYLTEFEQQQLEVSDDKEAGDSEMKAVHVEESE
jgi:hypothetical protein